jgi:trans-aconitate methyltransferase
MKTKTKIAEILLNYETDKNYGVIEPEKGHTYGESYDEIFERFDREAELNILEIGVEKGGSLCAWADYFPNANIYGVDIVDVRLEEYKRENINFILSDIKDPDLKKKFSNIKFDIIIDDGDHSLSSILYVVDNYLDTLNTGGYLIVEDVQQPRLVVMQVVPRIVDWRKKYTLSIKDLRDPINRAWSYDDFLIIIKKNE